MKSNDTDRINERIEIIKKNGVDARLVSAHDPIVIYGLTGRIPTYDHIQIGVKLSQLIASTTQPLPIYYVLNYQPNPVGYDHNDRQHATFKYPMISAPLRQTMLDIALQPYPQCISKNWEIQAGGMSYTLHTLAALSEVYPKNPIVFIAGDEYKQLHRWHKGLTICQYANIICINKKSNIHHLDQRVKDYLSHQLMDPNSIPYRFQIIDAKHPGEVLILSGSSLGLSEHSTSYAIECIHQNQIPSNIPPKVYQYVMKHNILRRSSS